MTLESKSARIRQGSHGEYDRNILRFERKRIKTVVRSTGFRSKFEAKGYIGAGEDI